LYVLEFELEQGDTRTIVKKMTHGRQGRNCETLVDVAVAAAVAGLAAAEQLLSAQPHTKTARLRH